MDKAGLKPDHAEITQRAANDIALEGEEAEKMWKLLEALEDLDDVQHVYSNADLPEDLVSQHVG
jgi:transcriptional/translational regulatory protein YebC/TACO1